jgi:hypothetical protein
MAANKDIIKQWFKEGKKEGATHMIVVCDTFDYDDYPVYVQKDEDARTKASEYSGKNMQRVMEVYNLSKNMEKQLAEYRAFNY